MLRLMAEMMKVPIALLVSGMEVLARAMQEFQQIANRTVDTTTETIGSGPARPVDTGTDLPPSDVMKSDGGMPSTTNTNNPQEKENVAMLNEQALSSDDLKTVRYRIIFTKRNHETTLKEAEATVNYSTDQGSLGGRYISDFWTTAGLAGEQVALKRLYDARYHSALHTLGPRKGKEVTSAEVNMSVSPPPGVAPVHVGWTLPDEDKKYVTFKADLLDQIPRQKGEYDREKVDELQRIRKILDDRLPPL
jgi:hypothetical protein